MSKKSNTEALHRKYFEDLNKGNTKNPRSSFFRNTEPSLSPTQKVTGAESSRRNSTECNKIHTFTLVP
jgi:hypothetical protein